MQIELAIMDALKKKRSGLRRTFTKMLTTFNTEIAKDKPDFPPLEAALEVLAEKSKELKIWDNSIHDKMVEDKEVDDVIDTELDNADDYEMKYRVAKASHAELVKKKTTTETVTVQAPHAVPQQNSEKLFQNGN